MTLGLRNVGLKTADSFDAAGWTAGLDYTAETAGPHSNVFRHTWIFLLGPFSIVSELDKIGWEPKKKAVVVSFWRERKIPSELWVRKDVCFVIECILYNSLAMTYGSLFTLPYLLPSVLSAFLKLEYRNHSGNITIMPLVQRQFSL